MTLPRQATVEDYHSSDSDHEGVGLEGFSRRPPAPAPPNVEANITAKRSSDMNKSPPVTKVAANIDLQSDSGYSSHTIATVSSADSGPSAKSQTLHPPTPPESAASAPASSPADRRRPPLTKDNRHSSTNSPRKPLARSGSVQSRNRPRGSTVTEDVQDCTDPKCKECAPVGRERGRRPRASHRDSGLSIDVRSQHSDPISTPSYAPPQSPMYRGQPDYIQGSVVVQPATARTRRASSVNRARPVSIAGGEMPQGYWNMPGGFPTQPQEPQHGPPQAYFNNMPMQHPQMQPYGGMMGASPSTGGFYHPQMHAQYPDMQRPPLPHLNSSNFNARRGYGPAVVTQEPADLPSARFPSRTPHSATQPNFPQAHHDQDDDEYSESEYEAEPIVERRPMAQIMPPPQRPSIQRGEKSERRKSLMSQSLTLEPSRDYEKDRVSQLAAEKKSRRQSVSRSRPPLSIVQGQKAHSAIETARKQVVVESPKNSRRQSYQYDKRYLAEPEIRSKSYIESSQGHRRRQTDDDLQRRASHRRSQVYEDEDVPRRRRQTDADSDRIVDYPGRTKLRDTTNQADAYISNTRGSQIPLSDHVHKAALGGSRVPSDGGSSHSDNKTRVSHRTTATNGGSGEIRLKIDQSSGPINLQFNGEMQGRTLRFEPAEDGMASLVIADSRGNENTYRSERGSVYGSSKKTVVSSSGRSRRDVDEDSIRSSQNSQLRRQRERERDIQARRELAQDPPRREYDHRREYEEEIRQPLRRKGELRYYG